MPGNRNGACSSRLRPRTTCTQPVSSGLAPRSSANAHPSAASGNGVVLGVVSSGASRSYISPIHHRHASGGVVRDSSAAGHSPVPLHEPLILDLPERRTIRGVVLPAEEGGHGALGLADRRLALQHAPLQSL